MTPEERQTPRFEPPPWEVEAFERFRLEQERLRAATQLEEALRQVKEPSETPQAEVLVAEASSEERPASEPAPPEAGSTEEPASGDALVPKAKIDAMLAELKAQETDNPRASQTLVYGSAAFLGTLGVFMVIFAITMYSRADPAGGSAMVLAMMTSLIMLLAGAGCIAGAVVLYRKHHQ